MALKKFAGVIQLVECQLPKLDVAGSSPVARSIHDKDLRTIRRKLMARIPLGNEENRFAAS